ncbi:MAG: hypothetical protein EBT59_03555 [Betaproteobacteria bacterium]|nr:hypothetical protein [Betaproteobacteria bacterium]
MTNVLAWSRTIKICLEKIAFGSGWLLVVLMAVTCIDIFGRKLGIPIPLTKFPRVDSYTEHFSYRKKAWIELTGCLLFALPYMLVLGHYSIDFFWTSFIQAERSENSLGLDARWLIKGIFVAGLWMIILAILSVAMRLMAYLFGSVDQSAIDLDIGHNELEV